MGMTKVEFDKYFELAQGKDSSLTLMGESADAISQLRAKAAISIARIGQTYAQMKDCIDKEYLILDASEEKITVETMKKKAEQNTNDSSEISRREMDWLLEALRQFTNACASRISTIQAENAAISNIPQEPKK